MNILKYFMQTICIVSLLFILSACGGGGGGGSSDGDNELPIPRDGLVGEWLFNGNANDTSGNANNGTVTGATLAVDRFGNTGRAYSFDGVDDYIVVAENDLFKFGTGNFTVSIWAKFDTTGSRCLLWMGDTYYSPWTGIGFWSNSVSTGRLGVQNQAAPDQIDSIHTGVNDNSWHHLVFMREGTELRLYVDGVLDRKVTGTGIDVSPENASTTPLDLFIGHLQGTGGYGFPGSLDDVRMYSRALTADEVSILYHTNGWKKTKTTWDVTKDFSINENPNGAWSYGWLLIADPGDFTVFPDIRDTTAWYDSGTGAEPTVIKRVDGGTANGLDYGKIGMHPGNSGEYSKIRWTAPANGKYNVEAQFFAGDGAEEEAYVIRNGVQVWYDATTSDNPTYSHTFSLAAGDTIDFAIGGNYNFGTTPVSIVISRE